MRLLGWSAKNWKCFDNVSLSVPERGVVVITGENRDKEGYQHNGVGKTSLLEIPEVVLFGPQRIAGVGADDYRRGKGVPHLSVSLESGGHRYDITRASGTKVLKDGELVKLGAVEISTELGVSRVAFRNAMSINFGKMAFLSLDPKHRVDFFRELGGVSFEEQNARLAVMQEKVSSSIENLSSSIFSVFNEETAVKVRFDTLESQLEEGRERQGRSSQNLEKSIEDQKNALLFLIREIGRVGIVLEKESKSLAEASLRLELAKARVCPMCGQKLRAKNPLPEDTRKALEEKVSVLKNTVSTFERRDGLLDGKKGQRETSIAVLQERLQAAKRSEATLSTLEGKMIDLRASQRALARKRKGLVTRKAEGDKVLESILWWKKQLGPRGLYTMQSIQGVVDVVFSAANSWLSRFDADCSVLGSVEERGGSVVLDVVVDSKNAGPFVLNSTGERQRVALALFLGANSIFAETYHTNMVALDDFDFGVDSGGRNVLIDIIREIGEKRCVFLATQSQDILDAFGTGVMLVKENGESRIV